MKFLGKNATFIMISEVENGSIMCFTAQYFPDALLLNPNRDFQRHSKYEIFNLILTLCPFLASNNDL